MSSAVRDVILLALVAFEGVLTFALATFGLTFVFGAPWVPTPKEKVRRMMQLAEAKPGETMMDLGSGDGSVLIIAAKEFGMNAIGYEINPVLRLYAKIWARLVGVGDKVSVRRGNFFTIDLPKTDIVSFYLLDTTIKKLEPRLTRDLPKGTRVVSRDFQIWAWPEWKTDGTLYAYLAPGDKPAVL